MSLKEKKTAILLGATGLTGGNVLKELLQDSRYEKIISFSRTPSEIKHPKIEEIILDLFNLDHFEDQFKADEVYCCIGTTQQKTPDKTVYRKIDYGIPVTAAKLTKKNNIPAFLVVSAMGADPESRFFYNKTKGEMEQDVFEQKIPKTYIFQPSLIIGKRNESRTFESGWQKVMKVGDHILVGPLKKYKSIKAESIAKAMIFVANQGYPNKRIPSDEITEIAKNASEQSSQRSSHAGDRT